MVPFLRSFVPPKAAFAAQKRIVIQICSQCGALLYEHGKNCPFCDTPLESNLEHAEVVSVGARSLPLATESASVGSGPVMAVPKPVSREPEWRKEVARRLEAYRARRRPMEDDSQPPLPFSPESELSRVEHLDLEEAAEPPTRSASRPRARQAEQVEISLIQPELDFSLSRDERAHPQTALVPVATIEQRRWAGLLDFTFLCITYAGFLGLFHSLGGEILFAKVAAAVYAAIFALLYALYFVLFTTLAGATPGMQLRGLYIVRLDGHLPDTGQLLWRSFGYIISAGTLMLGYLWALWDEDRFTWQDRISQTYLTSAVPLNNGGAIDLSPGRHSFIHR